MGFTLIGQLAENDREALLRALAPNRQVGRGAGSHRADLPGKIPGVPDRRTVDRGDHIARFDAGLGSRPICLRIGNQRTFGFLEANAVRNLGGHRLNLNTDPTTGDATSVLELGDHGIHGAGRDRESNSHRAAGGRKDRGVDPDDIAIDVKGRATGIALVYRSVDLDEVVVRAGADIAPARGYDPGGDRAAQAERIADRKHPVADTRSMIRKHDVGEIAMALDLDESEVG